MVKISTDVINLGSSTSAVSTSGESSSSNNSKFKVLLDSFNAKDSGDTLSTKDNKDSEDIIKSITDLINKEINSLKTNPILASMNLSQNSTDAISSANSIDNSVTTNSSALSSSLSKLKNDILSLVRLIAKDNKKTNVDGKSEKLSNADILTAFAMVISSNLSNSVQGNTSAETEDKAAANNGVIGYLSNNNLNANVNENETKAKADQQTLMNSQVNKIVKSVTNTSKDTNVTDEKFRFIEKIISELKGLVDGSSKKQNKTSIFYAYENAPSDINSLVNIGSVNETKSDALTNDSKQGGSSNGDSDNSMKLLNDLIDGYKGKSMNLFQNSNAAISSANSIDNSITTNSSALSSSLSKLKNDILSLMRLIAKDEKKTNVDGKSEKLSNTDIITAFAMVISSNLSNSVQRNTSAETEDKAAANNVVIGYLSNNNLNANVNENETKTDQQTLMNRQVNKIVEVVTNTSKDTNVTDEKSRFIEKIISELKGLVDVSSKKQNKTSTFYAYENVQSDINSLVNIGSVNETKSDALTNDSKQGGSSNGDSDNSMKLLNDFIDSDKGKSMNLSQNTNDAISSANSTDNLITTNSSALSSSLSKLKNDILVLNNNTGSENISIVNGTTDFHEFLNNNQQTFINSEVNKITNLITNGSKNTNVTNENTDLIEKIITELIGLVEAGSNQQNSNVKVATDSKASVSLPYSDFLSKIIDTVKGNLQLNYNENATKAINNTDSQNIPPKVISQTSFGNLDLNSLGKISNNVSTTPIYANVNDKLNSDTSFESKSSILTEWEIGNNEKVSTALTNDSKQGDSSKNHSSSMKLLNDMIDGDNGKNDKFIKVVSMLSQLQSRNIQTENTKTTGEMAIVNESSFTSDIIKSLTYMQKNDIKDMIVKIAPEGLGEMLIKVTSESGVIKASITAANKEAYNLLNSNLQDLNNNLNNQTIKIQHLNINIYNGDTTFFSNNNFSHNKNDGRHEKDKKTKNSYLDEIDGVHNEENKYEDSNLNALA